MKRVLIALAAAAVVLILCRPRRRDVAPGWTTPIDPCPNYRRLEDDSVAGCARPKGHPGACRTSFQTGAQPIPGRP